MKLKRTAAALTAAAMLPLCACQSAPPQVQLDPSSTDRHRNLALL